MSDYNSLKVTELKKALQDRSLAVSGNKAELIARLQEDDNKKPSEKKGESGCSSGYIDVRLTTSLAPRIDVQRLT